MGNDRMTRKRKISVLLKMPFAVLLWCAGLGLFWMTEKRKKKPQRNLANRNLVLQVDTEEFVIVPEKEYAVNAHEP